MRASILVGLLGCSTVLAAQPPAAAPATVHNACFDTIRPQAFTRVPVYVNASVGDSVPLIVGSSADFLAEAIAEQARTLLGAQNNATPPGEPRIMWLGLHSLDVTVYRNRPLRVKRVGAPRPEGPDAAETRADSQRSGGARLLAEALSLVRAQGEPAFPWPDSTALDSVDVSLEFSHPSVSRDGKVTQTRRFRPRPRFLVFSLMIPWQSDVRTVKQARIKYPEIKGGRRFTVTVPMRFAVDTTGRADPATITELMSPRAPKFTEDQEKHYRVFLEAARRGVLQSRYQPASFGGCKVRMTVVQAYEFTTAR